MPSNQSRLVEPNIAHLCRPIADLSPDPANLRLHDPRSIESIKASLRRFGQQKPIVVSESGCVIAGNGTLEAAKQLGWTSIACVITGLDHVEQVLYAIADNRTAELSAWDKDALASTLDALSLNDMAEVGFSEEDFALLQSLGTLDQTTTTNVPAPAPAPVAISRTGDLWVLGEHRLLCGDSTVASDVQRLMDGQRAHLFLTDPPYLVDYDDSKHAQWSSRKDWAETHGAKWDDADGNSDLYDKFVGTAVAHALHPHAAWYCWHAHRRQAKLEAVWIKYGAFVHCQIIWKKNRPLPNHWLYMWQHEPCFFGWIQGNLPHRTKGDILSTVWEIDGMPQGDGRPDHPTPKPLETFAIPMRQHLLPGQICYEPFSGSGTQIVVAEQLGCRCYAMEKEQCYVDLAIRRWQEMTGRAATLDGTGEKFAVVQAARHAKDAVCPSLLDNPADTPAAPPSSCAAATAPPTPKSIVPNPGRARKRAQVSAVTDPTGKSSAG